MSEAISGISQVRSCERLAPYTFAPRANSITVNPFASFDFPQGSRAPHIPRSYLGIPANFMGPCGVKIGPQLGAGVGLYGVAGMSVMNETLNIHPGFEFATGMGRGWPGGIWRCNPAELPSGVRTPCVASSPRGGSQFTSIRPLPKQAPKIDLAGRNYAWCWRCLYR